MIETILSGLAGAVVAAAVLYLRFLHRVKHGQVDVLARQFGLEVHGSKASGKWNDRWIEIRIHEIGENQGEIYLRVGGVDPRIILTREPFRIFDKRPPPPGPYLPPSLSAGFAVSDDIVTGDEEFDGRFKVKGPVAQLTGILNGEVRRFILATDALGITVADGWVTLRQFHLPREEDDLPAWIRLMAQLAESLAARGKTHPMVNLLENFRVDRDPEVRRVNLACLGGYFPDAPETLNASLSALTNQDSDWIRLQGAVNLRREGWPALRAIVDDPGRLDGVRAAALRALGFSLPPDEAEALLAQHLDANVPGLALSAVETLRDTGRTASVAVLLDRWADERDEKSEARLGREAAAKVRSRLEGAESGRLSIEDTDEEGRLSRPDRGQTAEPDSTGD